eukprot:EG_transcript_40104
MSKIFFGISCISMLSKFVNCFMYQLSFVHCTHGPLQECAMFVGRIPAPQEYGKEKCHTSSSQQACIRGCWLGFEVVHVRNGASEVKPPSKGTTSAFAQCGPCAA